METYRSISSCITGLSIIVLGVLFILFPGSAVSSISWLVGLIILISGISTLLRWLQVRSQMMWSGSILLSGAFQVLLGIVFINHSEIVLSALSFILAVWLLFEGFTLTSRAVEYRRVGYGRWLVTLLLGIGALLLGLWCMTSPVFAASTIVSTVLGICLIVGGGIYLAVSMGIKSINHWSRPDGGSGEDPWVDEQ